MSDLPQNPERSLSDDELVFGAQIMCRAFYRQEISDKEQERFVGLYGTPGRLLLDTVKWPMLLLTSVQLLVMKVPELQPYFIEQSTVAVAQSAQISPSSDGTLRRIARLMCERPELFRQLHDHHKARRRTLAAGLQTKKLLGRNDVRRSGHTPGLNTTTAHNRPNKD